jgi:hypothetical protein
MERDAMKCKRKRAGCRFSALRDVRERKTGSSLSSAAVILWRLSHAHGERL